MSYLYKPAHTKFWWIKFYDQRRMVRQSLRTSSLSVAREIQKRMDRQVKQGGGWPPPVKDDLPSLLDDFLRSKESTVVHSQWVNLKSRLGVLFAALHWQRPQDMALPALQGWINANKGHMAPNTIRNYIFTLRSFWGHVSRFHGIVAANPCEGLDLPKARILPPRYLKDDEYELVLKVAREAGIYLPVLTALKTGLRMSELRQLEWSDVLWAQKTIIIRNTKSNRPRSIPLAADLAAELEKCRKKRGYIFPGVRGGLYADKEWRNLLRPLQEAVPAFRRNHKGTGTAWHLLRHTWCTRLALAGVPLNKVQAWAGHKDIATTMRYAGYSPAVYDADIEKV